MARITHTQITTLHKEIAAAYRGINGFYRFNFNELAGQLRKGVTAPVMLLESYSSQLERNPNKTANFKSRDISFLLLDYTGKADNFDAQEEVLSRLDEVADDIATLLDKYRKDKTHWLYGLFDVATYKAEKVGPIFDNMYGWNILYTLTSQNPLYFDPDKWEFPIIPEVSE